MRSPAGCSSACRRHCAACRQDLEANFRAVLRERLSKLDLVSRDEFDAQARVLERTRAQLEALEARLATLEGGSAADPATAKP